MPAGVTQCRLSFDPPPRASTTTLGVSLPTAQPDPDAMHNPNWEEGGSRNHQWTVPVGSAEYDGRKPCRIHEGQDKDDRRHRPYIHRATPSPRHAFVPGRNQPSPRWVVMRATTTDLADAEKRSDRCHRLHSGPNHVRSHRRHAGLRVFGRTRRDLLVAYRRQCSAL
jgi:hypothetical protein